VNFSQHLALVYFTSGALMMGFLLIGMLFLRYWRMTGDRFFLIFASAFGLLAAERIVLEWLSPSNEFMPYGYLIRLVAYGCIFCAIVDKNRQSSGR
jgi:hypothetical protein